MTDNTSTTTSDNALTDTGFADPDIGSSSDSLSKPLSYGADLWDRFQDVCQKLDVGRESIKELHKYLHNIAELHDKLGKQLQKAAFADQNLGELGGPMKTLMDYLRDNGNIHTQTASSLEMLVKDLNAMRTEVSKAVKKAIDEEKKLRNEAQKALKECLSAKAKDTEKKRDFENLQITLLKSTELPPKKLQDLQSKCHNAEKIATKTEGEYREAVIKSNQARETFLSGTARLLMILEDLDKKRIRLVKSVLERFMHLHEGIANTTQRGCTSMAVSFEAIDANKDIQNFIMAHKTNEIPPPAEEFTPYIVKIPEEAQASRFSVSLSPSTVAASLGSTPAGSRSTLSASSSGGSAVSSPIAAAVAAANTPAGSHASISVTAATNGTSGAAVTILKRVRALYEYTPEPSSDAQELALAVGQEVDVIEENDDGWWVGRDKTGATGFFPSNYVEVISGAVSAADMLATASPAPVGIETRVALYDYTAAESEELSFNAGDIITVIEHTEDGWWIGMIGDRQGLFPHNYTEPK